MGEGCASGWVGGKEAVATVPVLMPWVLKERANVLGAESPFSATGGEHRQLSPRLRRNERGIPSTFTLPYFFVFRKSAKTGRCLRWTVHGVRNRSFQHTHLTW